MPAELIPIARQGLRSVIVVVALAYFGMATLLYFFQSSFVYFPDSFVGFTPADVGLDYREVELQTPDGAMITGWYVPRDAERATILFLHGNGGNIGGRVPALCALHDMGYATLIIDYHGYGRSTGRPSEEATYADSREAWNYLVTNLGIPPERIVLYGRSLGGALATRLAVERRPSALIVESSFTSIADMARRRFPYMPVRPFLRIHYDTLENMSEVKCPVLVAHGRADEMIPYEQGLRLFEAAPEPKQFVELKGGHNDGTVEGSDTYYRDAVSSFLDRHVPLQKQDQ